MASKLNLYMPEIGPLVYYQEEFRHVLELHLEYLRSHPTTQIVSPDEQQTIFYQKDFYGFLTYQRVPQHLHWIIMRMNFMYSPEEFTPEYKQLLQPLASTIDIIRQQYETQQKIF